MYFTSISDEMRFSPQRVERTVIGKKRGDEKGGVRGLPFRSFFAIPG